MRIAHFATRENRTRAATLAAVTGRQVREESAYYIPDPGKEESFDPDPELLDAADAHTKGQGDAMALLDDAENLLGVLLAAVEDEGDSRAMQVETVLKIVSRKLAKAHWRIDRQETRHRDLFLAYSVLKVAGERQQPASAHANSARVASTKLRGGS